MQEKTEKDIREKEQKYIRKCNVSGNYRVEFADYGLESKIINITQVESSDYLDILIPDFVTEIKGGACCGLNFNKFICKGKLQLVGSLAFMATTAEEFQLNTCEITTHALCEFKANNMTIQSDEVCKFGISTVEVRGLLSIEKSTLQKESIHFAKINYLKIDHKTKILDRALSHCQIGTLELYYSNSAEYDIVVDKTFVNAIMTDSVVHRIILHGDITNREFECYKEMLKGRNDIDYIELVRD